MSNQPQKKWTAFDTGGAVIYLAVLAFFYIGFFSPDPRAGTMVKILLWGIRLGLPVVGLGLLYLYYGVRTGKVAPSAVALLVGSLFFLSLLAYPVASYFYYGRSFSQNIDQYHPYLQLAPREFQPDQEEPGTQPLRIFCLGGSTTEYVDSQKRDWPSRLADRLQDAVPERPIEVYNQGRQWYTSLHTFYNYAANLRQHRPDVIVVMHAVNDLLHNADFCHYSFGEFREDYRHFYGPVYRLIKRPTLPETAWGVFRKMWHHTPREVVKTDKFPGLVPFARNLRSLIDLARADSVQVVLITQPYLFKDSMTAEEDASLIMLHVEAVGPEKEWGVYTAVRGMEQYNETIRRLAREEGVFLIDLEQAVPKNLEYFHDDVHYQDQTFDLVADYIAEKLLESDVLR